MKIPYKILYTLFLISVACVALVSCEDELRTPFDEYKDGLADVHVEIKFEQENEIDLKSRATGGADGLAIQNINTFCMLVYDSGSKKLIDRYMVYDKDNLSNRHKDITGVNYDPRSDNRLDSEKKGDSALQDKQSGKLSYDLKIYSGRYIIVGVANMGDMSAYVNEINTLDGLRAIKLKWSATVAENSQMIGVFSITTDRVDYREDKNVLLSATTKQMHCWLYRLASKVTVAFDGSELYDDVQVYIETVRLKDIPLECSLGTDNEPGKGEKVYDKKTRDKYLQADGDMVRLQDDIPVSGTVVTPGNYLHVCNGQHKYLGIGDDNKDNVGTGDNILDNSHLTSSKHSLFFYENVQGTGKSKKQSQDGFTIDFPKYTEGNLDDEKNGWKDRKPFGTYVEVKGFYRSTARDGHVESGPIVYRFMLGQDTDCDYNAYRNNHYKLTLKFKGYANDADWHIEYQVESGLHVVSPQYISYLYNKKMMAHIKIVGELDPDDENIYASIVGNDECNGEEFKKITGIPSAIEETAKDKTFWRPWGNGTIDFPPVSAGFITSEASQKDEPWNSFLSLRQTNVIKLVPPGYGYAASHIVPASTTYNYDYWKKENKGWRIYDASKGIHDQGSKDGSYTVQFLTENGTERNLIIPLYTRAKELVTKTAFTGNNPYSAYPRKMKIRFSAHMKAKGGGYEWKHTYLDIIQVRRLENPKGVWRSAGSHEPFTVTLMRRPNEIGDFEPFMSNGKWSAEIVSGGDDIITLSSTPEGSGSNKSQNYVRRVEGESEHNIDFKINFNGNQGFAIVKVRYHNYTCEHDIFCRNGYGDVDVAGDGTKWSSLNVYRFDGTTPVMTNSPLEEGSLFRRGSYTAILETTNDKYGNTGAPNYEAKTVDAFDLYKPDGTKTTGSWSDAQGASNRIDSWSIAGTDPHIATIDEFYTLMSKYPDENFTELQDPEAIESDIKKAYGIVYGDGATEVQEDMDMATGYKRVEKTGNEVVTSKKGMRGVVIYNRKNHKQLFLPVGASGYGRRKDSGGAWAPAPKDPNGGLRYASRNKPYVGGTIAITPLFYDLYMRPGAIYWCKYRRTLPTITLPDIKDDNGKPVTYSDITKSSAVDINYFTMGFEGYENNAAVNANGANSDACFIRIVNSPEKK